jgi:hypothetical protein
MITESPVAEPIYRRVRAVLATFDRSPNARRSSTDLPLRLMSGHEPLARFGYSCVVRTVARLEPVCAWRRSRNQE